MYKSHNDQIRSVYDLAVIIMDECSSVFFDRTRPTDERPQVLDIFSTAIGNVVREYKRPSKRSPLTSEV
jgi:hypothetical protein